MSAAEAMARCPWAEGDALLARYHDEEWGVPVHDPRHAFEHLILETFQAGLSWRVVLGKRESFRRAFLGFDPHAMAAMGPSDVERLAQDATLIRNRAKLTAAIGNARAFLAMEEEGPGFVQHVWSYVGGGPKVNRWTRSDEVPATDPVAADLARDLKERGFRFVGPTVMYAHMQATGVVNDHLVGCPRHAELAAEA